MKKGLFSLAALLMAFSAQAFDLGTYNLEVLQDSYIDAERLEWKVGDTAMYDINLGIAAGTMTMVVAEKQGNAYWLNQDLDLGGMGKQKVEVLIDITTGEILELKVNGQKRNIPERPEQELVETREDKVTVPAGTFDTQYLKIRNKSDNKITEMWINTEVPINGTVKSIAPGQFGKVKMDLTAYNKQ